MLKNILNLIYPRKCIFCKTILDVNKTKNDYICNKCISSLPFVDLPLVSRKNKDIDNNINNRIYFFDDCISSFYYEPPITRAICDFKFHDKKFYAYIFSDYIIKNIVKFYININFDFISYIPMYKSREKDRGFNQAKLLAKEISKKIKIPLKDLIIKIKNNDPQHNLPLKLRKINIQNVYDFSHKQNINQKTILLIDDIITSGFTLNEASKILKTHGAKKVYCATIATTKVKNKYSLLTYLINEKIINE